MTDLAVQLPAILSARDASGSTVIAGPLSTNSSSGHTPADTGGA